MKIPYEAESVMCFSTKDPKPDKLVVIEGTPITVHSAGVYPQGS